MSMIAPALFDEFGGRAAAHLDTDAISHLFSAPTLLVPAPGVGWALVLSHGLAQYLPGDGDGTWDFGEGAIMPRVFYGGDPLDTEVGRAASCQFLVLPGNDAESGFAPDGACQSLVVAADDGTHPDRTSAVENKPLVVGRAVADPGIVGDVSGHLFVSVVYTTMQIYTHP